MIRWLSGIFGLLVIIACVVTPVVLAIRQQQHTRNFHVVREGVLYRSGQMSLTGLKRIIHDHRIRTVINLRDGIDAQDRAEEDFCRQEEIRFIRLLPRNWEGSDGKAPVDDNVQSFLDVMADSSSYPVLVHCFAGIHRTGAYCAIYRMEFEGWSNAQAIAEVRAHGYENLDNEDDVRGYLERYRKGRLGHLTLGLLAR
jgi:protein tyrosine/serine phosphatase